MVPEEKKLGWAIKYSRSNRLKVVGKIDEVENDNFSFFKSYVDALLGNYDSKNVIHKG